MNCTVVMMLLMIIVQLVSSVSVLPPTKPDDSEIIHEIRKD